MTIHQSGVTIKEAAQVLGISEAAVRQRLLRRTLTSTRQNGRVFVLLPEDTDRISSDDTPDDTPDNPMTVPSDTVAAAINLPLVMQLREEISFLRGQVNIKDRQISELHVMLQTAQRQLPASVPMPVESPQRRNAHQSPGVDEEPPQRSAQREPEVFPKQRWPWWMRILGGR